MACGDVLSLEDLQTAKKHQIFEAEVITGKSGGVAGGASIDYATNQVTGQTQKTLPAILRDLGFEPASFDFTSGGTLSTADRNKAVLWPTAGGGDGYWYYWEGALPKVIPAASTPNSTGGVVEGAWRPVGDITLRDELAAPSGTSLIGTKYSIPLDEVLSSDAAPMSLGRMTEETKKRLCRYGAKVVLVGDSLSSFYNIDTVNISVIFESYLRSKILEINPSAKFINRAIGGMRYFDLGKDTAALTSASSQYPWYDNTSKRWMGYIDDLKPDVVILAFGMNDGSGWSAGNFQQPNFFKMMDELRSISSGPDIVFCTNILPSTENPDTSSFDEQSGRDAMAGWTRSYAKFIGASYIDLHRRFKSMRDGVDPCAFNFTRKTVSTVVNLPYTYVDMAPCYSARVVLIDPAVVTGGGIQFSLSQYPNNFLSIGFNSTLGRWETTVYTASNATVGVSVRESIAGQVPIAGTEIHFSMQGDVVTIFIGDNTPPVFSGAVIRFGGLFYPSINGLGSIQLDMQPANETPMAPVLTDNDVYNTTQGGNDRNHPTAPASSRIYPMAIDYWVGCMEDKTPSFDITADFISGRLIVANKFSPAKSQIANLLSKLTFINGAVEWVRGADGVVKGVRFGSVNRAYIDTIDFMDTGLSFVGMSVDVDFYAPSAQAYVVTLGEGTTGDRSTHQVTTDLRLRSTIANSTGASDLTSSASFPTTTGNLYRLESKIDIPSAIAKLKTADGFMRGNIKTHTISALTSTIVSKIKFGYASPSTFGGDIVIRRVRISFW